MISNTDNNPGPKPDKLDTTPFSQIGTDELWGGVVVTRLNEANHAEMEADNDNFMSMSANTFWMLYRHDDRPSYTTNTVQCGYKNRCFWCGDSPHRGIKCSEVGLLLENQDQGIMNSSENDSSNTFFNKEMTCPENEGADTVSAHGVECRVSALQSPTAPSGQSMLTSPNCIRKQHLTESVHGIENDVAVIQSSTATHGEVNHSDVCMDNNLSTLTGHQHISSGNTSDPSPNIMNKSVVFTELADDGSNNGLTVNKTGCVSRENTVFEANSLLTETFVDSEILVNIPVQSKKKNLNHHKKSNVRVKRRHRKIQQRNKSTSMRKEGGSRLVMNMSTGLKTCSTNNRTCLLDAVGVLLQSSIKKDLVLYDIASSMPSEGDTSIEKAIDALSKHGMELKSVTGAYNKRGGAAYYLLQEQKCNLIINIKLTNEKKEIMSHFVAWDGQLIYDRPKNIKVNERTDRSNEENSKMVFDKLFNGFSWQITNIYKLV